MDCMGSWGKKLIFQFNTPRYVHIESKGLGLMRRLVQLVILLYIIGSSTFRIEIILQICLDLSEGLPVHSTVVTKLHGSVFTNFTDEQLGVNNSHLYRRVWDVADIVSPSEGGEQGGFFIMTNLIITPNQTRGVCPEIYDPKYNWTRCYHDSNCTTGQVPTRNPETRTGRCVEFKDGVKTCEIHSWIPQEQDDVLPLEGMQQALLEDVRNFTLLIKNSISFPTFGLDFRRRNIDAANQDENYLHDCVWNEEEDKYCPYFRIRDIVGGNEEFSKVSEKGGVFQIRIKWDCNLDLNFEENCNPVYKFGRMDKPEAKLSPGFNFRYAVYHEENRRTLYKKYGIKFIVDVRGTGGQFRIRYLLLNIGSGLGLLGLAQIFSDVFVARLLLKNETRQEVKIKKYRSVKANEDNVKDTSQVGDSDEERDDEGLKPEGKKLSN